MRLGRLKDCVGFTLVGLHLLAIALSFFWLRGRLSPQSFQLTILIITPVTALYALAYLREVARTMFAGTEDAADRRMVTLRFAVLSILFTMSFSLGVIYTLHSFAFGDAPQDADGLKLSLSIIETALGAFIGLVVETLFGKVSPQGGG